MLDIALTKMNCLQQICHKLINLPKKFRKQMSGKPLLFCRKFTRHPFMFVASSPKVANFWQTRKNLPEVYYKHFFFFLCLPPALAKASFQK